MKKMMMVFSVFGTVGLSALSVEKPTDQLVLNEGSMNGWRVSVGLDYRFRYKTSLKMNTSKYNAAHPAFNPPQNNYPSRDDVLENIGDGSLTDGRRDYDNGYVDKDYATDSDGLTENWGYDNSSQYDGANDQLSFDSFYGVTESSIGSRSPGSVSDEKDMAGLSSDFARTVWQNDDFTVGVSAGFSYFPERNLINANQKFAAGNYRSEVWQITDIYDGGGSWLLTYVPVMRNEGRSQILADETFDGGAWVDSDIWLAEMRLCVEPEWRATDRFSLLSNLGIAVAYAEVSSYSGSWMNQSGTINKQAHSSKDDKWIVQAIIGLGARYMITDNIGLSVSGEARVPETEMDVDASPYEGDVEFGTWSTGAQLDYFF